MKMLRKQRFETGQPNVNTLEALEQMKIEKQKRIDRALKFGLPCKELEDEKKKMRAIKFGGGPSSDHRQVVNEDQAKRQMRQERFKKESGSSED
mmetsp:Transcript_20182/g.14888  ORF Transcript_20182/g.14888 Transcript_20182/m.14888 type:complete len:94 (+) Transcript_20182:333-614(+)